MKVERKFIEPSPKLAERIIKAAYQIKQKHSWSATIKGLFADFSLPHPAYIMPVLFLCGLLISVSLYPVADSLEYVDNLYLSL